MTAFFASAPAARVRLARDARTTLLMPALLVAIGTALVIGAVLLASGLALVVTASVGLVAALVGVVLAVRVRSLSLVVETEYLHLTGMGIDRRYNLIAGDLKRVASSGLGRVAIRPGTAALAFAVGQAPLGAKEKVDVIRLGATPSVVLVPTERGRVALAAAVEGELVQALMTAAAVRARVAHGSVPLLTATAVPAASVIGAPVVGTAAAVAPLAVPPPRPDSAPPPRPLTGIERMELEERLDAERRAAIAGARSEQAAASLTASAAAMTLPGHPAASFPAVTPPAVPAPAAAAITTAVPAITSPSPAAAALPAAIPATAPPRTRALPRVLPRRRPQRPMARRVGRPSVWPDIALLGGPLALAAVVWALAVFTGSRPAEDGLDPIGAALLLCGPIAVLAAWLARSRWPRLAGLTSVAAVISLALVARSLFG